MDKIRIGSDVAFLMHYRLKKMEAAVWDDRGGRGERSRTGKAPGSREVSGRHGQSGGCTGFAASWCTWAG